MDRDELSPDTNPDEESFFARWSRRKRQADNEPEETDPPVTADRVQRADDEASSPPADEDMPPIESLGDDDDYSGFLSPGVSEALRRRALKRLFLSSKFNVTDGLDDYAEDYTQFAPLGDLVTADMKHRLEQMLARMNEDGGEGNAEQAHDSAPSGQVDSDPAAVDEPVPGPGDEPKSDSEEPFPT